MPQINVDDTNQQKETVAESKLDTNSDRAYSFSVMTKACACCICCRCCCYCSATEMPCAGERSE